LGGKHWVKADFGDQAGIAAYTGLGNVVQTQAADPTAVLAYLRGAGPATVVGPEPVGGVATTHYRATVDVARALRLSPAPGHPALVQMLYLLNVPTVPMEVWIDHEGRARRVREAFTYGNAGAGGTGGAGAGGTGGAGAGTGTTGVPPGIGSVAASRRSVELTLELSSFGAGAGAGAGDVVDVPAAADVSDVPQFLRAMALAGGASGPGAPPARPPAAAVSPEAAALLPRLLASAPAGYVLEPEAASGTGPTNLDKAVRDDAAGGARDALASDGFVAGYERAWVRGDPAAGTASDVIIDVVYQFAGEAGAQAYADRVAASEGTASVPVEGVPGARGFTTPQGRTTQVVLTRGPFYALVGVGSGPSGEVSSLAQAQYERLA
jgi:hypothetical protein